jgi:hypothetical protein
MGNSLTTMIVIFLAAILLFIFPLMSLAEKNDNIAQLKIQTAVDEFLNDAISTGKITQDKYEDFRSKMVSTGNSFDVELEVKKLDENVSKKVTWNDGTVIGENMYISEYTYDIEKSLDSPKGVYNMKKGDILSVSVKNTNQTLSQTLRNVIYSITRTEAYQIGAQASGMVISTSANY